VVLGLTEGFMGGEAIREMEDRKERLFSSDVFC
jgi:hypothetical protein